MQQLVEQLISQLTGNALMFTAFDITMMLRRANPSTNIRHGEVRDAVHQLFTNNQINGYRRDLQRMDSGQEAYVFYPYGTDVEDYDPNFFATTTPQSVSVPNLSSLPTQVAASQPLTTMQTTTPTSSLGNLGTSLALKPKRARYSTDKVPQDKFGRLRVPACVLRAAGFKPSDTVRVVIDPNVIVVASDNDPYGRTNGKKYVVDQYNNIRVHLKGKFPAQAFSMQANGNHIYARPV